MIYPSPPKAFYRFFGLALLIAMIIDLRVFAGSDFDPTKNIIYYTENFPPYNMQSDVKDSKTSGKLPTGRNTDILVEMFKIMSSPKSYKNIQVVPWARGYKDTLTRTNFNKDGASALFSTTMSTERKSLFKWVCPLSHAKNSLITYKKNSRVNFHKNGLKDKSGLKFGVIREDQGHHILIHKYKIDPKNIVPVSQPIQMVKMIRTRKIDVISYDPDVFKWTAKNNIQINFNDFNISEVINIGEHCIAFSLSTPDRVVEAHKKALDQVKENPAFMNAIEAKYR